MKVRNSIIACLLVGLLGGCSLGPHSLREPPPPTDNEIPKRVVQEARRLEADGAYLVKNLERQRPPDIKFEPIKPKYDPLEDHLVSFTMVDEDLQLVLYSLAQAVGMNLIIDPSISAEKRLITLNFKNTSASTVLREILGSHDLYYEIRDNVIRVLPYEEKFFKLHFMDTNVDMVFDVGGDVLGAGEAETASGLSGSFKLSGTGTKKGNVYDLLEQMLQRVMTDQGRYSLNRITGTLYLKDTPGVVKAVSRIINHLRDVMARQILIEARIIEVSLSDNYNYGIDWEVLRRETKGVTKLNTTSWALGRGLVISGVRSSFNIDVAIDALKMFGDAKVVSNPLIRTKHGKPAIISVGTSITYKKSVSITTTVVGDEARDTTDVEVSTVFDGLILGLIPFIHEDGLITLLINPIKSDVDPESIEPVPVGGSGAESISLPKVRIKEMSTTISLRSGDVVFLGGLIDRRKQKEVRGVPFLSSIPLLGYLFKNETYRDETRELVIVMSVKVI